MATKWSRWSSREHTPVFKLNLFAYTVTESDIAQIYRLEMWCDTSNRLQKALRKERVYIRMIYVAQSKWQRRRNRGGREVQGENQSMTRSFPQAL